MLRRKIFRKSNERDRRSVNLTSDEPNSGRQTCSDGNVKENPLLTEEETREYFRLVEQEKILDRQLSDWKAQEAEVRSTQETMSLLHEYNDIKDITQMVLGAIAMINKSTIKDLHEQYDLPVQDN
ncbi:DNA repair protein SWI5 homolog [Ceratina calcarata]|uniref:DNA repair protein SWI5 homolog n=1 Tax=Ceratina calcarata TaxID=156304 RepID=A0AAJ7NAX9_9HYME|nr:DNA repair protein SWI5 homolog [Ceratina calcarata]